jgi:hypothetical protein
MSIFASGQIREEWGAGLRRIGPSLFLILSITNALAGEPIDVCALVTRADVEVVFGRPVISVRPLYRSPEAIQQLRTFLREEDLRQEAQRTGMDLSVLVEEMQCEYDTRPAGVAADLGAYPTHRFVTSVGRARDKEEAMKILRRVCRGEYQPSQLSQPLSGIGEDACATASSAVIVVKKEFILSLTLPVFQAGSRETVDLKSFAVKAVSRLP